MDFVLWQVLDHVILLCARLLGQLEKLNISIIYEISQLLLKTHVRYH
jgi:hypothetical protein